MAFMQAIYRGRRHFVVEQTQDGVWLEQLAQPGSTLPKRHVLVLDPDLLIDPTAEDLDLADAYERGEISAFEYPDGRTYPPGREIGTDEMSQTFRKLRTRRGLRQYSETGK